MSEHILSAHELDVDEGQIPREDWFESSVTLQNLRKNKRFPTIWCSGCGIGIVMGSLIRAIESLGLENDQVALVAGNFLFFRRFWSVALASNQSSRGI